MQYILEVQGQDTRYQWFNHVQSPEWKPNNWEPLICLALQLLTCKLGARLRFLCCRYINCYSASLFLLLFQLLSCHCQKYSLSILPSFFIKPPCEGGLLLFKILWWLWWLVNSALHRKWSTYPCWTPDFVSTLSIFNLYVRFKSQWVFQYTFMFG